jgi:hypothetical protein
MVGLGKGRRAARAVGEDVESLLLGKTQIAGKHREPVELVFGLEIAFYAVHDWRIDDAN